MSLRQRMPFKFSEDQDKDGGPIMDEQEQEEVINKLRQDSETLNFQQLLLMQAVVAFSSVLQTIYLFSSSKEPPIAVLFSKYQYPHNFKPIPLASLWTLLSLIIHGNLSLYLLLPSHRLRQVLSGATSFNPPPISLPLSFPVLFGLSSLPPLLSLVMGKGWMDITWWCETACLAGMVHTVQQWIKQESEGIRQLEGMRYDARGA